MGRGRIDKVDLKSRLMRMKNALYNGRYHGATDDWFEGSNYQLNSMLDIIEEYTS